MQDRFRVILAFGTFVMTVQSIRAVVAGDEDKAAEQQRNQWFTLKVREKEIGRKRDLALMKSR